MDGLVLGLSLGTSDGNADASNMGRGSCDVTVSAKTERESKMIVVVFIDASFDCRDEQASNSSLKIMRNVVEKLGYCNASLIRAMLFSRSDTYIEDGVASV